MRSKQAPSSEYFVIFGGAPGTQQAVSGLAELGTLQTVKGLDAVLLRSRVAADPKRLWGRLLETIGEDRAAAPAVVDERGEIHYPTGTVAVRFSRDVGEGELRRFASSHGLGLVRRNEYVPRQVVFQPKRTQYLPELIETLSGADAVESAWAETRSQFRR